jgi:hypothetical protein
MDLHSMNYNSVKFGQALKEFFLRNKMILF